MRACVYSAQHTVKPLVRTPMDILGQHACILYNIPENRTRQRVVVQPSMSTTLWCICQLAVTIEHGVSVEYVNTTVYPPQQGGME